MTDNLLFSEGEVVRGTKLLGFLDWAQASEDVIADVNHARCPGMGVLALPPLQRTPVWGPKQIIDLWDSALRGLPLGTLFLVQRPSGLAHGMGMDAPNHELPQGWDLLDGQQRLRALLLGLRGPTLKDGMQDKRCLWIDLAGAPETHLFSLHLTSESQPFGYHPETGRKLAIDERRNARLSIEPDPSNSPIQTNGRTAYNHELFSEFIKRNLEPRECPAGWRSGWPPLPARALASKAVFPLHVLLNAWRESDQSGADWFRALLGGEPEEPVRQNVSELYEALRRLQNTQIALVKVDVRGDDLLRLYDRIGAGGSPLTGEERLYSIYKHHKPPVHDAVNAIYRNVGRVLLPAKIAASAIRIANAQSHVEPVQGNYLPDVAFFAKEMAGIVSTNSARSSTIRAQLETLLPALSGGPEIGAGSGTLADAFKLLFENIRHRDRDNDIGVPTIMLPTLSANLIQVLLLWIIRARDVVPDVIVASHCDLIRFVMFWRLCVSVEDKAVIHCFEKIRQPSCHPIAIKALYDALTKDAEEIAIPLVAPNRMYEFLVKEETRLWRANADRFSAQGGSLAEIRLAELARRWWTQGEDILPWLQRAYLERTFPDFDPTSGRDDVMPYDVDHMIPYSDWGTDWRVFRNRLQNLKLFDDYQIEKIRWARSDVGNAIGNKWLVDFSVNRGWGNIAFAAKLETLNSEVKRDSNSQAGLLLRVFDQRNGANWQKASADGDHEWTQERLVTFQRAIEERSAWLYREFYRDLGFAEWESDGAEPIGQRG